VTVSYIHRFAVNQDLIYDHEHGEEYLTAISN
jgi:hypothetical protein